MQSTGRPTDRLISVGKYEVRRVLGRGAMGTVYEGWDPFISRRVAIKTVRLPDAADEEAQEELARFRREAQAAGRLHHPNLVGVYDYGETPDFAYIVMEFVDGKPLKAVMDAEDRLPLPAVRQLMDDLLTGLEYSHERGVIHRDIKPANLILTNGGRAKIADFGIARIESSSMTQAGTVLGTPAYMSPEQFMGQVVDLRTDVYSSGVLLYQLLTGEKPFEGSLTAIMHKVLNTVPPRPSELSVTAPPALDQVVATAMARRPEDRYPSASAFGRAIQAALDAPPGVLPDAIEDGSDATVVGVPRPAAPKPVQAGAAAPAAPQTSAAVVPGPAQGSGRRRAPVLPLAAGAAALLALAGGTAWWATRDRLQVAASTTPVRTPIPGPFEAIRPRPIPEPTPIPAPDRPAPDTSASVGPASVSPSGNASAGNASAAGSGATDQPSPGSEGARPQSEARGGRPDGNRVAEGAATQQLQGAAAGGAGTTTAAAGTGVQDGTQGQERRPTALVSGIQISSVPDPIRPATPPGPPPASTPLTPPSPPTPEALRRQAETAFQSVPCSAVTAEVGQDGGMTLRGFAGQGAPEAAIRQKAEELRPPSLDSRVATFEVAYCDALDATRPYLRVGSSAPDLRLQEGKTALLDGDRIQPVIAMPGFPAYLQVDYYTRDDKGAPVVLHMLSAAPARGRPYAARSRQVLAPPPNASAGWAVGEPFGVDLVVAVASSKPLLPSEQSAVEPDAAGPYVARLREAMASAARQGGTVAADIFLLRTSPRP